MSGLEISQYREQMDTPDREVDRETCRRYFRSTWQGMAELFETPSGIISNRKRIENGRIVLSPRTSLDDIGASLWSIISARDEGIITPEQATTYLNTTFLCLKAMEKSEGHFFHWYDVDDLTPSHTHDRPNDNVEPFFCPLGETWLATGLMVVEKGAPEFADQAREIMADCNLPFFYDPVEHVFHGGYYPDKHAYTLHHHRVLHSETRMESLMAIAKWGVPADHLHHLAIRTLNGQTVDTVFFPTFGGTIFEALLVPQFIAEDEMSSEMSLHTGSIYIQGQQQYADKYTDGYFGIDPCDDAEGLYQEYGSPGLGFNPYQTTTTIAPHASFLALRYEPKILRNLQRLETAFPDVYHSVRGFMDSVDVATQVIKNRVAPTQLAWNLGMSIAGQFNAVSHDRLRQYVSSSLEDKLRPAMASLDEFIIFNSRNLPLQ